MNPAALPALDLRAIHAPPVPEFWPPAPGWWVAAAVVISVLVTVSFLLYRQYRIRKLRQQVLAALDRLASGYQEADGPGFVSAVSTLLRQVALQCFPRTQVASLLGAEWLRFLDETGGKGEFSQGAGQILATGPYEAHVEVDVESLIALARMWIRKNAGACHEP